MAVQKTQKVPRIVANGALKRRQQASVRIRAQSICNSIRIPVYLLPS
jgi:hypothetical protein